MRCHVDAMFEHIEGIKGAIPTVGWEHHGVAATLERHAASAMSAARLMAGWPIAAILGGIRTALVSIAAERGGPYREGRQRAAHVAPACRVWVPFGRK